MLIKPDCIPCVLNMSISVLRRLPLDEERIRSLYSEILEIPALQGRFWDTTSSEVIESVMERIHRAVHDPDPLCAFSRMVVKINGRTKVYACTLVDDDPDYALGETLALSLQVPVSMIHHRCYSCFRFGATCSEMN